MVAKLAVDAVLIKEIQGKPYVLLIKRKKNPYIGMYALVGGKVEDGESLLAAVDREVEEEVGLTKVTFTQLHEFVNEAGWRSMAFLGKGEEDLDFSENDEVAGIRWIAFDEVPQLASNHNEMVEVAKKLLQIS